MTPDQTRDVLATAVRAPSVHNTQPWRFAVAGPPGTTVVDVWADRSRALPLQDPLGRELLLSCGAAAAYARVAVLAGGAACALDWLPGDDPDHLARLRVGAPRAVGDEDRELFAATRDRHTDRSAFSRDPVPPALVERLRRAAHEEGARLSEPGDADRVQALEVLVAHADEVLRRDPGLRAETRRWTSTQPEPAEGVPDDALPGHGRGRGSSLTLRDFAPEAGDDAPASGDDDLAPPLAEHPLLLVLGTDGDQPLDWLRAGAALAHVLLTATAAGLVANPQTQVLEVPGLRSRLVTELGLLGYPQVLLRAGWPDGPGSPRSGRRPLEEALAGTLPGRSR